MPEPRVAVARADAVGVWRGRTIHGSVALFVEARDVVVRPEALTEELSAPLRDLAGAEWRADTLTLHGYGEELRVSGAPDLDLVWVTVTERACALPEMARGLRVMGTRRGGDAALQARFFGPLLQARRRLQGAEPPELRVSAFDAASLARRVRAELESMAAARHPQRPPHRRALEAELLDAAEPLLRRLESVESLGRAVHEAPEHVRFVAWRRWGGELRALFLDADRCWEAIASAATRVD